MELSLWLSLHLSQLFLKLFLCGLQVVLDTSPTKVKLIICSTTKRFLSIVEFVIHGLAMKVIVKSYHGFDFTGDMVGLLHR